MTPKNYLTEFPQDANVRLGVTGLAFCKLNTTESTIHFLRHVNAHKLRLSIYRRRDYRDRAQIFSGIKKQPIGISENIKIMTVAPSPPDIFAENITSNEKLGKLINFPYYQGNLIENRASPRISPPTILSTDNFRFYTLELVYENHSLWDENTILIDNERIGYSLGGKVKVIDNSVTTLQIGANSPIHLPQNENGQWLYDILLENDCDEETTVCPEPDPNDLDFKYYYDVLEDEDEPGKKLRLSVSKNGEVKGEKLSKVFRQLRTGACNIAVLEPKIDPA